MALNVLATGIEFTPQGGSSVNLLDDYEEGTFTLTVIRSSMTIGDYSNQTGVYRKIGQQVTVFTNLNNQNLSGGSGTYTCGGFPFANNLGVGAQSVMGRNYMSADTNDRDFRLPNGETAPRLFITSADTNYQVTQTYAIWEFTITYSTTG